MMLRQVYENMTPNMSMSTKHTQALTLAHRQ
jgi:hypothetical protein